MVICLQRGANCVVLRCPADATATHCLLLHLNSDWFCLLVPANPGNNNNNNSHDNVYGAVIMTKVIARVHPVHLINVG